MRRLFFVFCILSSSTLLLFAHPHVYVDVSVSFEFDGPVCTGFWQEWKFDMAFSVSILQAHDANRDGKVNDLESEQMYNKAFINLAKYGFYTWIREGKTRTHPEEVRSFKAFTRNKSLVYRFFVPVGRELSAEGLAIAIFDTEYYTALRYSSLVFDVQQQREGAPLPKIQLIQNKDVPVYYNPLGAVNDRTVYTAWKPGLQTVYPEEIYVSFAQ